MNKLLWLALLLAAAAVGAQTYSDGTVVKWETESYSQSAHITRNQVVYSIQTDHGLCQIANRENVAKLTAGQHIRFRIDKNHLFILGDNNKEKKYEIVGWSN